jgi:hypothetical protein
MLVNQLICQRPFTAETRRKDAESGRRALNVFLRVPSASSLRVSAVNVFLPLDFSFGGNQ